MAQEPNEEGQKQPDAQPKPKKHPAEDFLRETKAARALPSARVHLVTFTPPSPPAKSPPTKPQP